MLNVVCINANNYQGCGVEYVENLHRMVRQHLSIPHKFIVFSDEIRHYSDGIEFRPLPDPDFKRWWHKISLFRPALFPAGDRVLYFDLSTVIMGSIDDLAAFQGDFCMTQPFGAKGPYGGLQSNVMAWRAGFDNVIYSSYLLKGCPDDFPGGDQAFIERARLADPATWEDIAPGKVKSFKWGLQGEYDGKASVVCFHGRPKPHELGGWAYANWSGTAEERAEVEIIRPMKFIDVCNTEGADILAQIKENTLARICDRVRLTDEHKTPAVIVGGGPSLADYVEDIRAKQAAGAHIFALNGAARWLYECDITPDYQVILDARPENITFLDWAISLPTSRPTTKFLLASQVHPSLFELLEKSGLDVSLWHIHDSDESLAFVREHEKDPQFVSIGVTVGISVMNLIWTMGYRKADLYGYDSSSAGVDMHHAYPQPLNDKALTQDFIFEGKAYRAQRALASQAQHFIFFYQSWERIGLKIKVHGEGLLPDMWRAEERERAASKGSLESEEAYKYRRCWQTQEYREYSPGEVLLNTAISELNPHQGARFIDFGCGTGRPAQKLSDLGFDVLCIDHAENCFDPDILLPFCRANLWELPEGIEPADYGYCTDVMEHIPEEKVDAVFAGISRLVKKAVFFNIAKHEVNFGHFMGLGDLHVTKREPEWWGLQLSKHFPTVRHIQGTLIVCEK